MAKQSKKAFIGIDLGGTNIQAGILGADGQLAVRGSLKTKADGGTDTVIARIRKLVERLILDGGLKPEAIGGLGIGAPGAIDPHTGMVLNAPNLRWTRFPLGKTLEKNVQMPVVVDNDVNAGAWGEYLAGAGRGFDNMLAVFVGTGIGGGLVLNGKLYYGHYHSAGEIGHTTLDANGVLGRRTLENLASRTNIANLLRQLIEANHPSVVSEMTGGDLSKIRSKVLAGAIRRKDPLTLRVVEDAAGYLGVAIANVVTLLSLPCVVVGGGVTEALGRSWVQQIRRTFEQHVFPAELSKCRVVASRLGDDAGIIGAALLAQAKLSE
jgi:glucokinase